MPRNNIINCDRKLAFETDLRKHLFKYLQLLSIRKLDLRYQIICDIHNNYFILDINAELIYIIKYLSLRHDLLKNWWRVVEQGSVIRHLETLCDNWETLEVHLNDNGEEWRQEFYCSVIQVNVFMLDYHIIVIIFLIFLFLLNFIDCNISLILKRVRINKKFVLIVFLILLINTLKFFGLYIIGVKDSRFSLNHSG